MRPVYLATVLAGLEHVLADELRAKVPDASNLDHRRGKVLFRTGARAADLRCLRTADNLYLLAGQFRVGPHRRDLRQLTAAIAATTLPPPAALFLGRPPRPPVTFVVNASRTGPQTYSRFEAAAAATGGLLARHPTWREGTPERHHLELRLDVLADGEALLAVRLTDPEYRFRGAERRFAPAALRPTVAHALVWLSNPGAADTVLDPFCGSGTILAERAAYPYCRLAGGDHSWAAVQAARHNLASAASTAWTIQHWDATRLPFRNGVVEQVISNLPFGRQISSESRVAPLYGPALEEVARVLAAGGKAIVLTEQVAALAAAATPAGLGLASLATLSLKGLHPQVLRLEHT